MATHTFLPDHYFNTIGTHEPVMHITPGDRVSTVTIDARGYDQNGSQVARGPNPMTGPFFVTGAEPGDTLVFRIEQVIPNRPTGWSSHGLAHNVVDPDYVRSLFAAPAGQPWQPVTWDLDPVAGTATLRAPETKLGLLQLPLAPMLGCFGVAPAIGEAISTATSGPHGGNMDYRGFGPGTTVYLPVAAPGGLLFLGDGHAVQGDGEIAGTGIEVSMDVMFSVDLVKNKTIQWPRGENKEFIFTAGNARPLDQALQHATTEMVRWLLEDYGLDAHSAGLLLGQTVQYEIGNVFDPAYTMVCKLSKQVLAGITR